MSRYSLRLVIDGYVNLPRVVGDFFYRVNNIIVLYLGKMYDNNIMGILFASRI